MQVLANLSLNNEAGVAKTFSALAPQNGVQPTEWAEKTYTQSSFWKRLKYRISPASATRTSDKVYLSLVVPKVNSIGGVETLAGVIAIETVVTIPQVMTDADVVDATAFHRNALSAALVKAAINAREGIL